MSKLLGKSKSMLESAANNLKRCSVDDFALDIACFDLHQSLEFALKYLFECSGKQHPWGHDITVLLDKLSNIIDLPKEVEVFRDKSATYTTWETESRYLDSFIASVNDANECVSRLRELHKYIDANYSVSCGVSKEILDWCLNNAPEALVKNATQEELLMAMLPLYNKYGKP